MWLSPGWDAQFIAVHECRLYMFTIYVECSLRGKTTYRIHLSGSRSCHWWSFRLDFFSIGNVNNQNFRLETHFFLAFIAVLVFFDFFIKKLKYLEIVYRKPRINFKKYSKMWFLFEILRLIKAYWSSEVLLSWKKTIYFRNSSLYLYNLYKMKPFFTKRRNLKIYLWQYYILKINRLSAFPSR